MNAIRKSLGDRFRSDVTEDVTTLYLRLNGYFTTGFILHSRETDKIHAEIDSLAVRFPNSAEPERVIGPDPFLEPSATQIDLLFCDVKCEGQSLQFNKAVRKEEERFARALRWSGMFSEESIAPIARQLLQALTPKELATNQIPIVLVDEHIRVRGVVSSPERNWADRRETDPWFLGGDKILDYTWRCLCPDAPKPDCSTRYDFTRWGYLEPVVKYFKNRRASGPGTIDYLYQYLTMAGFRSS